MDSRVAKQFPRLAIASFALVALASACDPGVDTRRQPGITAVEAPKAALMSGCGVSYTATTSEDSELQEFGVPGVHEVTELCETWTGSDYQFQVTIQSSDSPEFGAEGSSRIVMYSEGSLNGYDGNGFLQNASNAGSSSFAMLNATSDEVQASYDDPYYAILGSGGGGAGGGCGPPDCLATLRAPTPTSEAGKRLSKSGLAPSAARRAPDANALRHGLNRKGIRFLVNSFDEVASGRSDRRTFSRKNGDRVRTIELDRATQLIMVDQGVGPNECVRAEHQWRPAGQGMYVLARKDIDAVETKADGQQKHYRTTIKITNVKWEGQP